MESGKLYSDTKVDLQYYGHHTVHLSFHFHGVLDDTEPAGMNAARPISGTVHAKSSE